MTELTSEGVDELSTRGSVFQGPVLLYSFPSHSLESVVQKPTLPKLTLWFCVALVYLLLVSGSCSGASSAILSCPLPALCYFHPGHSPWPEDSAYSCVLCNMDVIFKFWEHFKIQKNIENYVIVPSLSASQLLKHHFKAPGSCGVSVWAWHLVMLN